MKHIISCENKNVTKQRRKALDGWQRKLFDQMLKIAFEKWCATIDTQQIEKMPIQKLDLKNLMEKLDPGSLINTNNVIFAAQVKT